MLDESRLVFEEFDNSNVIQVTHTLSQENDPHQDNLDHVPVPLAFDIWPENSAQSSPLLILPAESSVEEPTGRKSEGVTQSWDAGGEVVAQEYYSAPIRDEEVFPREWQEETSGLEGWKTKEDIDSGVGAESFEEVEGREYIEEGEEEYHATSTFQKQEIEEYLVKEEKNSDSFMPAIEAHNQEQTNTLASSSLEQEIKEEGSETPVEYQQHANNLTLPITPEKPESETTKPSNLPFLAGNPSLPSPPPQSASLPPTQSHTRSQREDSEAPGLAMEESQMQYFAPSPSPSCMCPCECGSTTSAPRQNAEKSYFPATIHRVSKSRVTKRPKHRNRYLRPPQTAKPSRRKTTTTSPAKLKTGNLGKFTSEVGFNYPDFDTFGEFGSVIKSKSEKSEPSSSQFYEAPSKSPLLVPISRNTTIFPLAPTYVTPNVVFTTPAPIYPRSTFTILPPVKPIPSPPQQALVEVSNIQFDDASYSHSRPSGMLPSSSAPVIYKAPSPSAFVRDQKYQTQFRDHLDSPLFYKQLPSVKKQTVYHMTKSDSKDKTETTKNSTFDEQYEAKTKEISAPQNMKVIFDFPCARSAVYDLNFVFKFCRKMGIADEGEVK